jgi:hypothetical protein
MGNPNNDTLSISKIICLAEVGKRRQGINVTGRRRGAAQHQGHLRLTYWKKRHELYDVHEWAHSTSTLSDMLLFLVSILDS